MSIKELIAKLLIAMVFASLVIAFGTVWFFGILEWNLGIFVTAFLEVFVESIWASFGILGFLTIFYWD